jgi:endonuclease V-like protein UPF0215 family
MARGTPGLKPLSAGLGMIRVDGLDASSLLAYTIQSITGGSIDYVLLDSLTIAGFNVVSPATLSRLLGIPVIVAYTYEPSYPRLSSAARRLPTFPLIDKVLRLVSHARRAATRKGDLYLLPWGLSFEEARHAVELFQLHSRKPEPVRAAHYLASTASRIWFDP